MKKAINITISNCVFYVEEDAYGALSDYMESIKEYFDTMPEAKEIFEDMEARIAEHFQERSANKAAPIITRADVEELIKVMGKVEDIAENGEKEGAPKPAAKTQSPRRLFRNPDNNILFGVCGGLGAYFNVDPLIFRIAFVISTLFWGWGLILYIILWLIVPEASSQTDKMEMWGKPITVASLKKEVKDVANRHKKEVSQASSFVKNIFEGVGAVLTFIFKKLIPAVARVIAGILVAVFGFGMLVLTFGLTTAAFNYNSPYIDIHLGEVLGFGTYYTLLISLFFALFIPLVYLFFLALSAVRNKTILPKNSGFVLFAFWIVSLSIAGSVLIHSIPAIKSAIKSDPSYIESDRLYPVEDFSGIQTKGTIRAVVVPGDMFEVKATGNEDALEELSVEINNGVLEVKNNPIKSRECFICFIPREITEVRIVAPEIKNLEASDTSRITTEAFSVESIEITANDVGRVEADITASEHAVISAAGASRVQVSGEALNTEVKASNATRVNLSFFESVNANVEASNAARVVVLVSDTLTAIARDAARIQYIGDPILEINQHDASSIVQVSP